MSFCSFVNNHVALFKTMEICCKLNNFCNHHVNNFSQELNKTKEFLPINIMDGDSPKLKIRGNIFQN